MKKIFITLIILASISIFLNTNAITLGNYQVLRIFDLPTTDNHIDVKYSPYNSTKKLGYTILTNSIQSGDRYSQIYILGVDKDFSEIFGKDIKVENAGINGIGNVLSTTDMKVFTKDRNKDKKIYKGQISYEALKDGINYISICAKDIINSVGKYTNLKCAKTPYKVYYIKEYNKIVSEEEYLPYLENFNKKQELKRQQELRYIENVNKYFDDNKIKKSRFGSRSRIKTSKDLEKLLFDYYQNSSTPITLKNLDKVVNNVANKFYTYDDNNKALSSFSGFQTYVKYLFKKFIYQKEHPETIKNTQNSNTTSTENTNTPQTTQNINTNQYSSNNSNFSNIEKFKEQNAKDRAKAIDFSKKLLKVLEKYKTKEKKLEKLQYIKEIINTQYSPEKFKNQNLIGYVKDYLDIVEYAINLQ